MCGNPLKDPIGFVGDVIMAPIDASKDVFNDITGKTAREEAAKAAKKAEAEAKAERERQQAIADAELAKQQELADAKTAYESGKLKERTKRLATTGGGLSTKYQSANLGATKDTLGG